MATNSFNVVHKSKTLATLDLDRSQKRSQNTYRIQKNVSNVKILSLDLNKYFEYYKQISTIRTKTYTIKVVKK